MRGALIYLLCLTGCDRVLGLTERPPIPIDAIDAAPPDCPADYGISLSSSPSSRYRIDTRNIPWTTAAFECADDAPGSTHLIVIDQDAERLEIAAQHAGLSLWIGLTDRVTENVFLWVTKANTTMPPTMMGAEPWGPGQPDNGSGGTGNQDCVRIQGSNGNETLYDDGECTAASYAFACECDAQADDPTRYAP